MSPVPAITEPCGDCDATGVAFVRLPGGTRCARPCLSCDGDGERPVRRCSCGREPCVAVLDQGTSFERAVCDHCLTEHELESLEPQEGAA